MADWWATIAQIGGWISPVGSMATMISPTRAVAIASTIPPDIEFSLRFFGGESRHVSAVVIARDERRDLALLETSTHEIPASFPDADDSAQVYFVVQPGNPRVVEAKIVARDMVAFEPVEGMSHAALGAPIVSAGSLFGMIHRHIGEGSWRCIPAAELSEDAFFPSGAPFDEAAFFSRLTAGALRALGYAAGAAQTGQVEMNHLLYGLQENYAGTTRRLFRAHSISVPVFDVDPVTLTALPPRDADVQQVLEQASTLADSRGEREIRGRHILYGALAVSPFAGLTEKDVQLDDDRSVLGHRADTIDGEDLLDIKREARVLAGVLGADTVEPPISLGLFGEWGSGKSFFMREMERQFTGIEGKPGYCHNIVQIWFNAWHYIDTPNLWASLAAEIFERLDFELSVRQGTRPRDETAHARAGALAKSAKARSELAGLTADRTRIESDLQDVESGLADLQDERAIARSIGVRSVFTAAVDAASIDKDAKKEIGEIGERITRARETLHLTEPSVAELRETTDRGRAIVLAAKKMPLTSWLLVILFALLIVGGLAVARQVDDAVRVIAGFLGVAVSPLIALLTPGGKAAGALYKAWTLKERLIEEERARRAKPLIQEHDRLARILATKKAEEETKAAELAASEDVLAKLEPKRQMSNFVAERKKSTDYTKHLGVIASAHDDFAELSRLLKRAAKESDDKSAVPPVDRIVLYIDDLDRCPEDKVVDVLQAVHLLLAFPLFIVVVGVDSRWLLHSLQRHLRQFGGKDLEPDESVLWKSTPLNYLEKIFQIPFTIRRMRVGAFGDLIENLTRPQDQVARERAPVMTKKTGTQAVPPPPAGQPQQPSAQGALPATASQPQGSDTAATRSAASEPAVDYLTLKKWETDDMKVMYPLIPSPRAAKRFVNTYRLMRGMIDEYERPAFIGEGLPTPGQYRAAMLMLAMLTGYPEDTTAILRELVTSPAPDPLWWSFIVPFVTRDDLRERLAEIQKELPFVPPTAVFAKWAPDVARFSFHSGRMVSTHP